VKRQRDALYNAAPALIEWAGMSLRNLIPRLFFPAGRRPAPPYVEQPRVGAEITAEKPAGACSPSMSRCSCGVCVALFQRHFDTSSSTTESHKARHPPSSARAEAAAAKIGQFIKGDREASSAGTGKLTWSAGFDRNSAVRRVRLCAKSPAITELRDTHDANGKERRRGGGLRGIRGSPWTWGFASGATSRSDPTFAEAVWRARSITARSISARSRIEPYCARHMPARVAKPDGSSRRVKN